jgi:hypothetical protein
MEVGRFQRLVITIFGSSCNRFIRWGTIRIKNNATKHMNESYLELYYADHNDADTELCKTAMDSQ